MKNCQEIERDIDEIRKTFRRKKKYPDVVVTILIAEKPQGSIICNENAMENCETDLDSFRRKT